MRRRDPLPDDLAALGAQLEAAAQRSLERRAALRRSLHHGLVAVLVGAPLALVAGTKDVEDASRPVDVIARLLSPADPVMTSFRFPDGLEHVPDATLTASSQRPAVNPSAPGPAYFRRSN